MNDKTVIVTGASQGSGRAIAEAFLEASYTVVGLSRRRPEWGAEYSARFIPFSCDVSVEAEVERTAYRPPACRRNAPEPQAR